MGRAHEHTPRGLTAFAAHRRQHLPFYDPEFFQQRRGAAIGIDQALFAQMLAVDRLLAAAENDLRLCGFGISCGHRRGSDGNGCAFRQVCWCCGRRRRCRRRPRIAAARGEFLRLVVCQLVGNGGGFEPVEAEGSAGTLEQRATLGVVAIIVRRLEIGGLVHGHIPLRPPSRPGRFRPPAAGSIPPQGRRHRQRTASCGAFHALARLRSPTAKSSR